MVHRAVYEVEQHDDTALVTGSPGLRSMCRASMDYAFSRPLGCPDQYVVGSMCGEMLEWMNTTTALKGDNRLGFDQERTGDLSFTRSLWAMSL